MPSSRRLAVAVVTVAVAGGAVAVTTDSYAAVACASTIGPEVVMFDLHTGELLQKEELRLVADTDAGCRYRGRLVHYTPGSGTTRHGEDWGPAGELAPHP